MIINNNVKIKNITINRATDVFKKQFIATQKEIATILQQDSNADWIVGNLPKTWLERIPAKAENEKEETAKKIFQAFRAAIKYLRPYNAPIKSKQYNKNKADAENRRIKEASNYLTKALRHFGIISESTCVNLKRRKVYGEYINRGYVLSEKGQNPTLEKLFIKTFKKLNPELLDANYNGIYAEAAHGLNLNELGCKHLSKLYWGDIKGSYMTTEYETPPKHCSPIIKFKKSYDTIYDFAKDFYKQTGIELSEMFERGITIGKTNKYGKFEPKDKEYLLIGYLQSVLEKAGLYHGDLHKNNAIIGTDSFGKPILKIIDFGGIMKK